MAKPFNDESNDSTPQTQLIKNYGNIGFGGKKDIEWYMRALRSVELSHDTNLTLWYNTKLPFISQGAVLQILAEEIGMSKAREYVHRFVDSIRQLYYGPGVAYLVAESKSSPNELLYSTLGWIQLQYPSGFKSEIERNTPMIKTNFKIDRIICPRFNSSGKCMIYNELRARGPSSKLKRMCEKCRSGKSDVSVLNIDSGRFKKGVSVHLFDSLRNECRKQIETLASYWITYTGECLGSSKEFEAPSFDSEYAGKIILPTEGDPNKNWQESLYPSTPVEHLREGLDYVSWLKSEGYPVTKPSFENDGGDDDEPTIFRDSDNESGGEEEEEVYDEE